MNALRWGGRAAHADRRTSPRTAGLGKQHRRPGLTGPAAYAGLLTGLLLGGVLTAALHQHIADVLASLELIP